MHSTRVSETSVNHCVWEWAKSRTSRRIELHENRETAQLAIFMDHSRYSFIYFSKRNCVRCYSLPNACEKFNARDYGWVLCLIAVLLGKDRSPSSKARFKSDNRHRLRGSTKIAWFHDLLISQDLIMCRGRENPAELRATRSAFKRLELWLSSII